MVQNKSFIPKDSNKETMKKAIATLKASNQPKSAINATKSPILNKAEQIMKAWDVMGEETNSTIAARRRITPMNLEKFFILLVP